SSSDSDSSDDDKPAVKTPVPSKAPVAPLNKTAVQVAAKKKDSSSDSDSSSDDDKKKK
ncbi:unnamed protein product, partial [Rotaria magnacalcarata]